MKPKDFRARLAAWEAERLNRNRAAKSSAAPRKRQRLRKGRQRGFEENTTKVIVFFCFKPKARSRSNKVESESLLSIVVLSKLQKEFVSRETKQIFQCGLYYPQGRDVAHELCQLNTRQLLLRLNNSF